MDGLCLDARENHVRTRRGLLQCRSKRAAIEWLRSHAEIPRHLWRAAQARRLHGSTRANEVTTGIGNTGNRSLRRVGEWILQ